MRRDFVRLLLWAAAYLLPLCVFGALGLLWVIEHDVWLPVGVATAVLTGIFLACARWLPDRCESSSTTPPTEDWPEAGRKAWKDVEAVVARTRANPPRLEDQDAYLVLFWELLDRVGSHFHPECRRPGMELSIQQALEIGERILRDVRLEIVAPLPVIRSMKVSGVHGGLRARKAAPYLAGAFVFGTMLNRLRRWLMNPPVAVAYEASSLIAPNGLRDAKHTVARMTSVMFVRHVGKYAIDAFANMASLDISPVKTAAEAAPIRILLLGPVKAGKSSLLNALFGQERARIDVLPSIASSENHVLQRDNAPFAVVQEAIGFSAATNEVERRTLDTMITSFDLIVAVTSATQAAKQTEREILSRVRTLHDGSPRRAAPPIVVAVTHVDELKPIREWDPPYDFRTGDRPKECCVREAVDSIGQALGVPTDAIIPVCTAPERTYDVEERLLPAIGAALPAARRAQLLRLIEADRSLAARERAARRIGDLLRLPARLAGFPATR